MYEGYILPAAERRRAIIMQSRSRPTGSLDSFDGDNDATDGEWTPPYVYLPTGEHMPGSKCDLGPDEEASLYEAWVQATYCADENGLLRIVHTADGAHDQYSAWLDGVVDGTAGRNTLFVKLCAGASMSSQPMDLTRCHQIIRSFYGSQRFIDATDQPAPWWHPNALECIEEAGGMALSSLRSYSVALHTLPLAVSSACTVSNVRVGFNNLLPLSPRGLLRMWPGYEYISGDVSLALDTRIPEVVAAYARHKTPDEAEVMDILKDVGLPARPRDKKNQVMMPVNQYRAIPVIPKRLLLERQHYRDAMVCHERMVEQEKQRSKAEKTAVVEAQKLSRKRKGSNLRRCGAHVMGCASTDDGTDSTWTSCGFRRCGMRVCPAEDCLTALRIHKNLKKH